MNEFTQKMWNELRISICLSLLVHLVQSHYEDYRVLLSEVKVLTLYKDRQTQARRVPSIPQLTCIGGSARCAHVPDHIQCYNQGSDGIDIQWKCNCELPTVYKLGRLDVVCEGYDSPDDPYILVGSCGLEYNLEYADEIFNYLFVLILLFIVILILFAMCLLYSDTADSSVSNSVNRSTSSSWSSSSKSTYTSTGYGGTKRR